MDVDPASKVPAQSKSKTDGFKLPPHVIRRIESRNKRRIKPAIHRVMDGDDSSESDAIQNMIDEMIDRLCITQAYLSPTVLIDTIALLIRSYLVEELHVRLSQPLRHFTHSPSSQFGISLFPPKSHGVTHPLVLNDKIQFEPLHSFDLGDIAYKFTKAVFIGMLLLDFR